MTDSLIGQTIGQYTIEAEIGKGGMATVYKAYQPSISRYVAMKVLAQDLAKDPNFAQRFKGEAKAVAALEHPNILPVYDFGSQQGVIYMVMRYVQGGTIADLIASEQKIPYARTVEVVADLASALDYAHSLGIVHRDVKPSNVLIDRHGQALLTDFGLAKMIEATPQHRLTQAGTVVGTASYMSPEQAADEPLDGRSDVYSLGVVLFEMLTGHPPFEAETMVALALKHINEPIPSLRAIDASIPEPLEQVVFKAMEKWADDRYQTAAEMKTALTHALLISGSLEPPPARTSTAAPHDALPATDRNKADRRRRPTASSSAKIPTLNKAEPQTRPGYPAWLWGGAAAAVVVVALALLGGLLWWQQAESQPASRLLNAVPNSRQLSQALGSLENSYSRSNYALQYFNEGAMYWWENPATTLDPIYVIEGESNASSGDNWSQYKNTWTPDEPIIPDFCPRAAGINGPVMIFGRLWCYNFRIKAALGAALAPEISGNNATIELFSNGVAFSAPEANQIWVLHNDGSWQMFEVAP